MASAPGPIIIVDEVRRAWASLTQPGEVYEVRALGAALRGRDYTREWTGYFDNVADVIKAIGTLGRAVGVFVTLNPVNRDLLARVKNRLTEATKGSATSDPDVVRRRLLLIDIDPVRPAGISSTDAELESAMRMAEVVAHELGTEGWPDPIIARSGNGAHLLYLIDLPNDDASRGIVERCIKGLSARFSDDALAIDTSVFNAARISCLYGTKKCKGDDAPEIGRPHRFAQLVIVPEPMQQVPVDLLTTAGASLVVTPPPPPPTRSPERSGGSGLDPVERCRRYVAKMERAISGSKGHNVTLQAACTCFRFGLSDAEALDVMRWYNSNRCDPAWNDHELAHKVADARKKVDAAGEFGVKLREQRQAGVNGNGKHRAAASAPNADRMPEDDGPPVDYSNVDLSEHVDPIVEQGPPVATPAPAPVVPDETRKRLIPYKPFPTHLLPGTVGRYVEAAAAAMPCDAAFIALPLLAALGAAIGNTRRLLLKSGWLEPPVIWSVIIADSGSMKSPAWKQGMWPILKREAVLSNAHKKAMGEWSEAHSIWKKKKKSERDAEPAPVKPPPQERALSSDVTTEAVALLLQHSPRGLLVGTDELGTWFGSFDQYKAKGKGDDAGRWLSMFNAATLIVDRKVGDIKHIYVPDAAVCVTGTIQPSKLKECLTDKFFGNGLAARILMASPPKRRKEWSDIEVDHELRNAVEHVFNWLFQLRGTQLTDGNTEPTALPLSSEAKEIWVNFVNGLGIDQVDRSEDKVEALWSKLEGYAGRFALIIHQVRHALGEDVQPFRVDEQSVAAGIELAQWFGYEAERIYAMMGEAKGEKADRELVEFIRSKGGQITARELLNARRRRYPDADSAKAALRALQTKGLGVLAWKTPEEAGGRPKEIFHLDLSLDFEGEDLEERLAMQEHGGG